MNTPRVVYDTMVFFQWAVLQPGVRSGTSRAVEEERIKLCVSPALLDEVRQLLARPAIREKRPNLTDERVRAVLEVIADKAESVAAPAPVFTHSLHKKDDHVFNLAIASSADMIVTWENRHLEMQRAHPKDHQRLIHLAPQLRIVDPATFVRSLYFHGGEQP